MHLNNPFDRPNPIRAKHHATNLIYQEPIDLTRASRRRSEHGMYAFSRYRNDISTDSRDIEFIDLSVKEPGDSRLEFLKLNNPYLAARGQPPVLTSRTNNFDSVDRPSSFSTYQRPSTFYKNETRRFDNYTQESPMKTFDLQGSRGPAVSLPTTYSPPMDYNAVNFIASRLFDRATQGGARGEHSSFSQYEQQTYREEPSWKPPTPTSLYEPVRSPIGGNDYLKPPPTELYHQSSRTSNQGLDLRQPPFPTQAQFEDHSADELMMALLEEATKAIAPSQPELPEFIMLDGVRYYMVDIRAPRK